MKLTIIALTLICVTCKVNAQQFKNLRFTEDYSYLKDSTNLSDYEKFKFTRLNNPGTNFLSMGGEVRYQYFIYENEEWGDAAEDSDGFILNRLLLHTDLKSKRARLFVQLQSSLAVGRIDPSPVELNELDLHQTFLDVSLVENVDHSLVFRVGRQELSYGSSRLVSVREGPNSRQAFDGVKFMFERRNVNADVFYADYVFSKKGIFNDKLLNNNLTLGGLYIAVRKVQLIKNIDVYYLGLKRVNATWNDVQGDEVRQSIGSRIWGGFARWQYDFEGVYQFGDLDNNRISAWTVSSNLNYSLRDGDVSPILGVKTEIITGDKRKEDGRIQSFNPLFPKGAYFGYAALIGPSNLFDIHPSVNIPIGRKVSASIDYDIFWRYSIRDGIYDAGTNVIYPAGSSDSNLIGHQVGGIIEFEPTRFMYFRGEFTWFKSGSYIKSMGAGKDVLYMGITSTLKF